MVRREMTADWRETVASLPSLKCGTVCCQFTQFIVWYSVLSVYTVYSVYLAEGPAQITSG